MSHTYTDILVHALFGAKDRQPSLTPDMIRGGFLSEAMRGDNAREGPADAARFTGLLKPRSPVLPQGFRHGLKDAARVAG
jgi:hypothetical protein